MSNRKLYKDAMSGVHHSDKAVERIFEMTIDKKANKGLTFKRLASAALAFALLIGGGFGTNAIVQNSRANQPLGVMVAYADEFMKIESGTNQTVCKSLYFAPADDEEKCNAQKAKAEKDYEDNREIFNKLAENNESASLTGVGCFDIYDQGNITTKLYTTGAGFFATNKTNYKNVKSFTVENESEDGYLQFEWSGTSDLIEAETEEAVNMDNPYANFINHKFTLTGDELRQSQETFNKHGYTCEWVPTAQVLGNSDTKYGKDFDATSINDKITFTFEYNDGTTESASVNIGFDSNGHMVVS